MQEIRKLPAPKLLEYILFPIFIFCFFLTLCVFDIIQRISSLFGQNVIDKAALYFNKSILNCLKILGTKIEFKTKDELPNTGPCIIVSNHQSMFDIPLIHCMFQSVRPRFISKKELARYIPGVSICLKLSRAAIIDRSDANQAISEINKFCSFLKQNKFSGVIFPEGTRAKDGVLKAFKKRGLETLLKETAPCYVIPVAIQNSWKFQYRKFGPIPVGIELVIISGKPIFVQEDTTDRSLSSKIEDEIKKLLTN